ncbi:MAG: di-trans,poly-cis-decaprenylcistransferase, partial [Nitrospinae bacterium]|nr:di-trans,poly-cis-decaprenylcistransferase [Nitrospinota bacterium]
MAENDSQAGVDRTRLPRHIAVIMDGNGRWAAARRRPRIFGHHAGVATVDRIVTYCRKIGVEYLTLYSFSEENWARPADEVGALMGILKEYLKKELARMLKEGIRFNTIGDLTRLPPFAREAVEDAVARTADRTGMTLTLALSYGARQEIVEAARRIARDVAAGTLAPDAVDEAAFASRLSTAAMPDPDLMIRTSGELRISNFLLWQSAYSELWFTDKFWP